tara:strand:+ start:803 stop:1321 length:519 start_codon:yes stop_codon:yes gene_type:complete
MSQVLLGFEQLEAAIERDEDTYTQSQKEEIDARLAQIRAAIENDQVVRSRYTGIRNPLYGADDCIDWSRSDASTWDRAQFHIRCTDWEYQISGQLEALGDYLESIGASAAAEITSSVVDTSRGATELAGDVVPDASNLWDSTPTWVKFAVPLGALAYFFFSLEVSKAYVRKS